MPSLSGQTSDNRCSPRKTVADDVPGLQPGQQRYSQLLNEAGGILDDLMISRVLEIARPLLCGGECWAKDMRLCPYPCPIAATVEAETQGSYDPLALQGPKAEAALAKLDAEVRDIAFHAFALLDFLAG